MAKQLVTNFRKSSSLIILAKDKVKVDQQADFKALLFNRHEKATFMPNSAVFPGGVCEAADETPLWRKHFDKLGVTKDSIKALTEVKGAVSNIYKNENADVLERYLHNFYLLNYVINKYMFIAENYHCALQPFVKPLKNWV